AHPGIQQRIEQPAPIDAIVVGKQLAQIGEQIKVGREPEPEGAEQIGLTLGRRDHQPEKGHQKVEHEDEQEGHGPKTLQVEATRTLLPGDRHFLGGWDGNGSGLLTHGGYTPACFWVTESTPNEKIQVITASTTASAAA